MKTDRNIIRLEGKKNKIRVILNSMQDLPCLSWSLRKNNDLSGRFHIKCGMTFFNNAASGFTLIELLVVVLIIGILAAVAVPQYQKAVEKARLAEVLSTLSSIQKGIDAWLLENGGYPAVSAIFLGETADTDLALDGFCSQVEKSYTTTKKVGTKIKKVTATAHPCISGSYEYRAECFPDECKVVAYKYAEPYAVHNGDQPASRWYLTATEQNTEWTHHYSDGEQSSVSAAVMKTLAMHGWSD